MRTAGTALGFLSRRDADSVAGNLRDEGSLCSTMLVSVQTGQHEPKGRRYYRMRVLADPGWQMRRELLSLGYTTRWGELPQAV